MILERYLLKEFMKVLSLSVMVFLGLLITTRFHEIASFAAFGCPWTDLTLFVLLQFPFVLPAVIPIGAFLSVYLLLQRMSQHQELTSLRASGLSLWKIAQPLLLLAALLSLLNFILVSEVSTRCHLQTRLLERRFKGVNPLVLLKHPELIRMKGVEVVTLGSLDPGERAEQLIVAVPHPKKERLMLFLADELQREGEWILGQGVSFITAGAKSEGFGELFVDHSKTFSAQKETFSKVIKGDSGKVSVDYLSLPLLLHRMQTHPQFEPKAYSDLFRRISLGLEPLTLVFLGISFGVQTARVAGKRSFLLLLGLVAANLASIFFAKSLSKEVVASFCLYMLPHPLLWTLSWIRMERITKGLRV